MTWSVEYRRGNARELLDGPVMARATVFLLEPDRPAIVLGSRQDESIVERRAVDGDVASATAPGLATVDVVRRRSGGTAVFVDDSVVWVDVVVPRTHPGWDDDISKASVSLGRCWVSALRATSAATVDGDRDWMVHDGPMERRPWSELVCFGGLGPGEVHVGGRKVVGIAQRRTREWALFQCALVRRWDPSQLLAYLLRVEQERADAGAALVDAAIGVVAPRSTDLVAALAAALPQ